MVLEQHQHLDHRHHLAARQLLEVVPPLGEEPHSAEVPHLALVARYLVAAAATSRQQGQVQEPVQDLQGNTSVCSLFNWTIQNTLNIALLVLEFRPVGPPPNDGLFFNVEIRSLT